MSIARRDLRTIARARLADAEALFRARRYDAAAYMCGYVVELALKARICRTLRWPTFPETRGEFEGLASLRTHDLDVLLRLSGQEAMIRRSSIREWNVVNTWRPERRYLPVGTTSRAEARAMLDAAHVLLRRLA